VPKRYTSAELIKIIERDGWYLVRIKGSHHHFKHQKKKGVVTIAHPNKDMETGTVQNILRQASIEKGDIK